jgi:hypothetical protein
MHNLKNVIDEILTETWYLHVARQNILNGHGIVQAPMILKAYQSLQDRH